MALTSEEAAKSLMEFLPGWLSSDPELTAIEPSIVLHGSVACGMADAHSDIDLWGLVPREVADSLPQLGFAEFYAFDLAGVPGHLNLISPTWLAPPRPRVGGESSSS